MTDTNLTEPRIVQLQLPATVERNLRERADAAGISLEVYLEELAEQDAAVPTLSELDEAIRRMTSRTPEQILADRERVLRTSRKGRALPEGKTLVDVVEATWPGYETDEQINEMLEELSLMADTSPLLLDTEFFHVDPVGSHQLFIRARNVGERTSDEAAGRTYSRH